MFSSSFCGEFVPNARINAVCVLLPRCMQRDRTYARSSMVAGLQELAQFWHPNCYRLNYIGFFGNRLLVILFLKAHFCFFREFFWQRKQKNIFARGPSQVTGLINIELIVKKNN